MHMKWGWWRLFACLLVGASRQLIHELCDNKKAVPKALHAYLADAKYCYRELGDFQADVVQVDLLANAELAP